jgi:hypothetical protein
MKTPGIRSKAMQYKGKVYGKVAGKYVELEITTEDIDQPAPAEQGEGLDEEQARALLYAHGLSSDEISQVEHALLASRPQPEAKVVPMAMLLDCGMLKRQGAREIAASHGYTVKE